MCARVEILTATSGHSEITRLLLDAGADPFAPCIGVTPLQQARKRRSAEGRIVRRLIDAAAQKTMAR